MAAAKNKVIAGDYSGWDVIAGHGKLHFMHRFKRVVLDRTTVARYEAVDARSANSFWGSFLRGYVGNAVLGPAGLFAANSSAAGKRAMLLAVEFVSGERSLIEVDDGTYRKIVQVLF